MGKTKKEKLANKKTMFKINSQQKNIDYFGILRKAWEITWKNKYLWWLGLFAAIGGGFNMSFPIGGGDFQENPESGREALENISTFFSQYAGWIIIGAVAVAVMVVILLVLRTIGQAGITKMADNIRKNQEADFKMGFQAGKKYFWKIFLTNFLLGLFLLGVAVVLFLPVGYLFYLEALPLGFISLFLAGVIFIILAILAFFVRTYSLMYIVLGNLRIISAIENAYRVFQNNLFPSVIMSLIFLLVGIILGVSMLIIFLGVVLLFFLVGLLLFLLLNKLGIIIAVTVGALAVIAIFLFIRSVCEVFFQSAWVLFFSEIAEIKEEQPAEVSKEVVRKEVPDPGMI